MREVLRIEATEGKWWLYLKLPFFENKDCTDVKRNTVMKNKIKNIPMANIVIK